MQNRLNVIDYLPITAHPVADLMPLTFLTLNVFNVLKFNVFNVSKTGSYYQILPALNSLSLTSLSLFSLFKLIKQITKEKKYTAWQITVKLDSATSSVLKTLPLEKQTNWFNEQTGLTKY